MAGAAFLITRDGDDGSSTKGDGPVISLPEAASPEASSPEATSPEITNPEVAGSATLPELSLSDLSIPEPPDLSIPNLSLPDLSLPDLSLPDVPAGGSIPPPTEEPEGLGGDPQLDALAQACYEGELGACDELYRASPAGSDYETYGDTCAGRQPPHTLRYCTTTFGDD